MGVWPWGAQVRARLGINWKPDSSANTIWAPSRVAFFLSAGSLFASNAGSTFRPAPELVVRAYGDSISSHASTDQYDPGDTELQTHAGSVPRSGLWSIDWFGNHGRLVLEEASPPSAFDVLAPASAGGRESNAPAKPWLRHAGGDHASASPNWHCIRCVAPLR